MPSMTISAPILLERLIKESSVSSGLIGNLLCMRTSPASIFSFTKNSVIPASFSLVTRKPSLQPFKEYLNIVFRLQIMLLFSMKIKTKLPEEIIESASFMLKNQLSEELGKDIVNRSIQGLRH